ncbi:FecR domain-containing protein [Sphingomonas sp. PB2P12]|uniref:FecR family protein n=1 Tax=Sphingomonas sandaracina TaxID=3096157 RepID=UPI002FC85F50
MTHLPIDDEALDWAIRMAEPDADWDAFMTWLEGDATRSARYDRAVVAIQDAATAAALPAAEKLAAVPHSIASPRSRRWVGAALAASLAGAIGFGAWTQMPRPYAVETRAGERRTVALDDGSSILLAGASKVTLDANDPRLATVDRGEMLFRVRHDAARPFAVRVDGLRLIDLGTVFDVKTAAGRTVVAVAEGAVMVDPDGAAMRLAPGQAVVADGTTLVRRAVDVADVGGWHAGRLAFDDVPLSEVAADLSRHLGRRVTAAPAIARRTFRGTLNVTTVADRPALLGTLLDVTVRQTGEGWMLEPRR